MTLRPKDDLPLEPLPVATNVTVPIEGSEATRRLLESMRSPPIPESPATEPTPMKRLCWVPAPAFFNLNACCFLINQAHPESYGVYLVGSCLRKRDYRDVDVRMILGDADFERWFPGSAGRPDMNALWSLMCTSISCWLQAQTGLPVDFQIQQQTAANAEFSQKNGHARHHIGLYLRPTPRDYAQSAADGAKL